MVPRSRPVHGVSPLGPSADCSGVSARACVKFVDICGRGRGRAPQPGRGARGSCHPPHLYRFRLNSCILRVPRFRHMGPKDCGDTDASATCSSIASVFDSRGDRGLRLTDHGQQDKMTKQSMLGRDAFLRNRSRQPWPRLLSCFSSGTETVGNVHQSPIPHATGRTHPLPGSPVVGNCKSGASNAYRYAQGPR